MDKEGNGMPSVDIQWLAAMVESSEDAIVSKTLEGMIVSWNPGAERLFGFTAEEMIGRPITRIFPADRLAEEVDFLARLSRGERVEHYETMRLRKDGSIVHVSVSLSPIRDAAGRIFGVAKVARDITDRKRLEDERAELLSREQRALAEAVAANRVKDEFIATVSHELRTPVNAIIGWSHLLTTRALNPDDARNAIDVIARNARLQARLIDDLLDLSSIMVGRVRLDVRPVDLASVIHAAVESLRPSATIKQLTLDVDTVLTGEPPIVMGDAGRLQQVIWNLLTNAVKFTPSGGRVALRSAPQGRVARLQVSDTGVGIPRRDLATIFERFRQVDSSATRRHRGLGLGLAIVKHLVQLHGGSVWAESEGEGCGSRFTIELPLLRGHAHGVRALAASTTRTQDVSLDGVRVLVVEDDQDSREMLTEVLSTAGAAVQAAESAAAGLTLAQAHAFDVVVTDIGLPETDGYAFYEELRLQGTSTPCIALTAFLTDTDRERGTRAGFQAYLGKPIDTEQLLRAVANAASHPSVDVRKTRALRETTQPGAAHFPGPEHRIAPPTRI